MPTILHITDTHLSTSNTLFRENLELVRAHANASPPDLIVNTGDLSLDGAGGDADLDFAMQMHRDLPAPLLALPGNHDSGSHPQSQPRQPLTAERMDRFHRIAGPGRGIVDLPGWRVIGLNSEVMDTGHPEEAAQEAFIREAAAGAGDRRIALFLHKPVFVTTREDPNFDVWSVPPQARASLAPLLDHPGLRLVASGHLHLHHRFTLGRVAYVWAPALSFVVNPREQVGLPGERICGALRHVLHEDHVETELVVPEGMVVTPLDDVLHLTYGR
jgi:alkaline phosphatase D